MSLFYRIFDITVQSDFGLPELPLAGSGVAAVRVCKASPGSIDESSFEQTFEWTEPRGSVICRVMRRGNEYLYVFDGFASYLISAGGMISCMPHEHGDGQMIRHLLLNQLIPRYLASQGRLVLHASAVTLVNGHTVAFLGNSGRGKSTLASSFHRHGAVLIDDDCLLLEPGGEGVTALGGFPGIRLFPDSLHAVFDENEGFSTYSPYSSKQQLLLKNEVGGKQADPQFLDALFVLEDPESAGQGCPVSITPLIGSKAVMAMISCAFCLDPADKQVIAKNFRNIGQAMAKGPELYSLQYQRDHGRLAEVRVAIEACLAEVAGPSESSLQSSRRRE
jgi:hypothetical protein